MKSYPQHTDATFDGQTWNPGAEPGSALQSLTVFQAGGHRVFNPVYGDEESWRWLFRQRRAAPADPKN